MVNLLAAAAENAAEYPSTLFVVLLGIGVVFLGLIFIVLLCMFMSLVVRNGKGKNAPAPVASAVPAAPVAPVAPVAAEIPDKQAFIAAVSAAIAEDMGTDVSALRILSIKRL